MMEKCNVVETLRTPTHELGDRDDSQVKQAAANFDVATKEQPKAPKEEVVNGQPK